VVQWTDFWQMGVAAQAKPGHFTGVRGHFRVVFAETEGPWGCVGMVAESEKM